MRQSLILNGADDFHDDSAGKEQMLLTEYSTYMTKLADFARKTDDYETEKSEMSAADYNYFIIVYARIAQKLANASASLLG